MTRQSAILSGRSALSEINHTDSSPVRTRSVESRRDARAFRDFPYLLYRDDPLWVAPLKILESRRWLSRHNASLSTRRVKRFLAHRGNRVLGRIAAIIDPAFAERWQADSGFFGFFECTHDGEAARALFGLAESQLKHWGVKTVFGPVNLSTQEEVGLLIDGFGTSPTLLTPYNPQYYEELVLMAGYRKAHDYNAYLWRPESRRSRLSERLASAASRPNSGITIRSVDMRRWKDEARTIWCLYNETFSDVWGFVPLSWEEFRERADGFVRFLKPELALIVELNNVAAGFALILPDINEILRPLGGRLLPLGWLRLVQGRRHIKSGRLILLGIKPSFVGRGLSLVLSHKLMSAAQSIGLQEVESSLVGANNHQVRRVLDALGLPITKTYRLYSKTI